MAPLYPKPLVFKSVYPFLPLLLKEPRGGDLDLSMKLLQLGYKAAGLPAEGKFTN